MKELLILIFYLNVQGLSDRNVRELLEVYKKELKIGDDILEEISHKYKLVQFFVPVVEGLTRFEFFSSKSSKDIDIPGVEEFLKKNAALVDDDPFGEDLVDPKQKEKRLDEMEKKLNLSINYSKYIAKKVNDLYSEFDKSKRTNSQIESIINLDYPDLKKMYKK